MHGCLQAAFHRTVALSGPAVVVLAACSPAPRAEPAIPSAGDPALQIHHAALTIDAHIDIRTDFNGPGNNAGRETVDQIDLPKLECGGLDVATLALFAESHQRSAENIEAARAEVEGDDPQTNLDDLTYARYLTVTMEESRHVWHNASLADYIDAVDYASG